MEAELQGRDDPEVWAGPAHRPEQVRMVSLARSNVHAISGHELDGRQVVDRQAEASLEPADAPAECQAGDAGVPDGPDGAHETMGLGRAVEFAQMRPPFARPRRLFGSTETPRIRDRSMTTPSSQVEKPVMLWGDQASVRGAVRARHVVVPRLG